MNSDELRSLQSPLKEQYRNDPEKAQITLKASGELGDGISCSVQTSKALVEAGLHPATGGNGMLACSGDMLLESLIACSGVTLQAVATALGITVSGGIVSAEGDLDFRGTLGVDKDVVVGFKAIRLCFDLDTEADESELQSLLKLTKRYCVVYQTLMNNPSVSTSVSTAKAT